MKDRCLQLAELVVRLAIRFSNQASTIRSLLTHLEDELELVCAESMHKEETSALFIRFRDFAERIAELRSKLEYYELIARMLETLVPHVSRSCGNLLKLERKLREATRENTDIEKVEKTALELFAYIGIRLDRGELVSHKQDVYKVFEELCVRRLSRRLF
ncbi:MAG: hypothetical protein QW067_08875 [Thermofilaceae archaeon]